MKMSDYIGDMSKKAIIADIIGYKVTHALGLFVIGSFAFIGFKYCLERVKKNV